MGRKNYDLWDLGLELFSDKITLLIISIFIMYLKISAWVLGFFPVEQQPIVFILTSCILGFLLVLLISVIIRLLELPSFVISFFR